MNPWIPHLLRASGGGGGSVLPPAGRTLLANLTSSLILDEGTGGPTWSRATKAWGFNELGYLKELASGCAFFGGARLVRNLVPTPSNTLAVAGTKTVTLTQAATLQFSMGAGAGTATFSGTGGATGTLAAGASRVSVNKTVTEGTFIVTASVNALVDLSIVDVTGYPASYVPEYVSVGVVSAPFPAGIDGAKYFETDWQGAPIAAANLLGFRREPAATNNVLHSRDFLKTQWTSTVFGSNLVTNGDFSSDTVWYKDTGWSISGGAASYDGTKVGSSYFSQSACVANEKHLITFDIVAISGSLSVSAGNLGESAAFTTTGSKSVCLTHVSGGNSNLVFWIGGAHTVTIDNVVITRVAVQAVKTATGIDGIANTASTLTAAAADAVILQPITLASAARCASAYVKRRTGTGTISFTQDGGSTWTDITSQINSSTWSRVQITSTLANPSVGFKISTSGDAIDVDCVQNEAGAVATSPIVTTTATVYRGASSLTYQTASNWSDTAGTAFIEAKPGSWSVVSGSAIGSATNGLLLSSANSGATAYDGTNAANGPVGVPSGKEKLAMRWTGAVLDVASSGALGTPVIYDGAMGLPSIAVGAGVTVPTYFKNLAIYSSVWTDDEIKANVT